MGACVWWVLLSGDICPGIALAAVGSVGSVKIHIFVTLFCGVGTLRSETLALPMLARLWSLLGSESEPQPALEFFVWDGTCAFVRGTG